MNEGHYFKTLNRATGKYEYTFNSNDRPRNYHAMQFAEEVWHVTADGMCKIKDRTTGRIGMLSKEDINTKEIVWMLLSAKQV